MQHSDHWSSTDRIQASEQQYLDCGSTAVEWKREESPGAVSLFWSTVSVNKVCSSSNSSTRDGHRKVSDHSHPPISRTHYGDMGSAHVSPIFKDSNCLL